MTGIANLLMDNEVCIIGGIGKDPVLTSPSSSSVQVSVTTIPSDSIFLTSMLVPPQSGICISVRCLDESRAFGTHSVSTTEPKSEFKESNCLLSLSQEAKKMI